MLERQNEKNFVLKTKAFIPVTCDTRLIFFEERLEKLFLQNLSEV